MTQATTTTVLKNTTAVWNLTPPANLALIQRTSTACDTPSIKIDVTDIRFHSV